MQRLYDAFRDAGHDLYLVGGAVRDLLLGCALETLDDLDFCTDAAPERTLEIVVAAGLATYDEGGTAFGTIGVLLDDPDHPERPPREVQITTYRSRERYDPGSRKPVVEFGTTILEDLGRRDLSINSIAMDADGRYVDPYQGQEDIRRGILRVVTDPGLDATDATEARLREDPLRILRVARFLSRLGFEPTDELLEGCCRTAPELATISRERWFIEMNKLLLGVNVRDGLDFLQRIDALGVLFPEPNVHEASAMSRTRALLAAAAPVSALRWACLFHVLSSEQVEAMCRRLRFDNALREAVLALPGDADLVVGFDGTAASARRIVYGLSGALGLAIGFARTRAVAEGASHELIDGLGPVAEALEQEGSLHPVLPTGIGRELVRAWNLRPGPVIGRLRDFLIDGILEGRLENGRDMAYYLEAVTAEDVGRLQ